MKNFNPNDYANMTQEERHQAYLTPSSGTPEPTDLSIEDISHLSSQERSNLYEKRRVDRENRAAQVAAVSYTHLTLPTILRV